MEWCGWLVGTKTLSFQKDYYRSKFTCAENLFLLRGNLAHRFVLSRSHCRHREEDVYSQPWSDSETEAAAQHSAKDAAASRRLAAQQPRYRGDEYLRCIFVLWPQALRILQSHARPGRQWGPLRFQGPFSVWFVLPTFGLYSRFSAFHPFAKLPTRPLLGNLAAFALLFGRPCFVQH